MPNERKVVELNIQDVLPNRFQPRIKFDETSINELAVSIKKYGVIQPIVVRKIGDKYEIIAGERRYKASVIAGKSTIPAIVCELNDNDSVEIALIENVQREDLTPIEKAISYKKILDVGYMNQEELAQKIGKSQSAIANTLRLLALNDDVQEALLDNKISERHARSLLRIKDNNKQTEMLNKILDGRLTVRKADEEIDKMLDVSNEVNNLNDYSVPGTDQIVTIPDTNVSIEEPVSAPGFMNIDKIENEAQDILEAPKPVANMSDLLQVTVEPTPTIEPAATPSEDILKPGKFFNFFGEEEKATNMPEDTFDFDSFFGAQAAVPTNNVENNDTDGDNGNSQFTIPFTPVESTPNFEIPSAPVYEQPSYQAPVEPTPSFEIPSTPVYEQTSYQAPVEPTPSFEIPSAPVYEQTSYQAPVEPTPSFEIPSAPVYEQTSYQAPVEPTPSFEIPSTPVYEQTSYQAPVEPTPSFEIPSAPVYEQPSYQAPVESTPSFEIPSAPVYEQPSYQTPVESTPSFEMPSAPVYEQPSYQAPVESTPSFEIPSAPVYEENKFEQPKPDMPAYTIPSIMNYEEPIVPAEVATPLPAIKDVRAAINVVRDCSNTIEKMGFTLDVEEIDFEDSYQVIFKISKN